MTKSKIETSIEDDIHIDEFNLKGEVIEQPTLYYKWTKKYAKAKASSFKSAEILKVVRSEAKAELENVRATLDSDVRDNWDVLGFDKKPTEAAISAWIVIQGDYVDQSKASNDMIRGAIEEAASAIEDEEILEGAKLAMSNKKISLQDLAQMKVTEFYSEPKIDRRFRELESQEDNDEVVNQDLNEKMKRRVRNKK